MMLTKAKFILTISADDRPGLISKITGMLNRKQIEIDSLSAGRTDVNSKVVISIVIVILPELIRTITTRIENIIEVFTIDCCALDDSIHQTVAFFRLSKSILSTSQGSAIGKFGGQIINLYPDSILVAKAGTQEDIFALFRAVDGEMLLRFTQGGLIADTPLVDNDDDSRVVNRVA